MQCTCVMLFRDVDEKFIIGKGCLNIILTFLGGHWRRVNIQCSCHKVVCLFEQETSGGRDGHQENKVGTLRRDIGM